MQGVEFDFTTCIAFDEMFGVKKKGWICNSIMNLSSVCLSFYFFFFICQSIRQIANWSFPRNPYLAERAHNIHACFPISSLPESAAPFHSIIHHPFHNTLSLFFLIYSNLLPSARILYIKKITFLLKFFLTCSSR